MGPFAGSAHDDNPTVCLRLQRRAGSAGRQQRCSLQHRLPLEACLTLNKPRCCSLIHLPRQLHWDSSLQSKSSAKHRLFVFFFNFTSF